MNETNVIVVGDGPGGLSAALFLAKNDVAVEVFGTDETPMHKALLKNYLGIEEMTGSEFQKISREQVQNFGAGLHDAEVVSLEASDDGFRIETDSGAVWESNYIIVGTTNKSHLEQLGVRLSDGVADVDRNGCTNVDGCYAVGWATRKQKIQAIISAGDGAAAALDILSDIAGEDVHDFDVV